MNAIIVKAIESEMLKAVKTNPGGNLDKFMAKSLFWSGTLECGRVILCNKEALDFYQKLINTIKKMGGEGVGQRGKSQSKTSIVHLTTLCATRHTTIH